jgi:hypothetical protein
MPTGVSPLSLPPCESYDSAQLQPIIDQLNLLIVGMVR